MPAKYYEIRSSPYLTHSPHQNYDNLPPDVAAYYNEIEEKHESVGYKPVYFISTEAKEFKLIEPDTYIRDQKSRKTLRALYETTRPLLWHISLINLIKELGQKDTQYLPA